MITMSNALFTDEPTSHRIPRGNRKAVVYARYDWMGNFIRFVAHLTPAELRAEQAKYLPARVGIVGWYEVYEWQFV